MSVAEIENAIEHLSVEEKKILFRDLALQLEEATDALELEQALREGDPMPYEDYRKQRFGR